MGLGAGADEGNGDEGGFPLAGREGEDARADGEAEGPCGVGGEAGELDRGGGFLSSEDLRLYG